MTGRLSFHLMVNQDYEGLKVRSLSGKMDELKFCSLSTACIAL